MDATPPEPRPGIAIVIVPGLVAALVFSFGAFLASLGWPAMAEGFLMHDWLAGPGRVVEARMPKIERSWTDSKSKDFYTLELAYEYDVAGRTYRGDRTGLFPDAKQWQPAKAFVAENPPGRALTVWHHPRDPGRSVLDPTIGAGTWAMSFGGLPFLALGGVMLVGFARAVRLVFWGH